jgi:holo-[acyl-carrier protein] synthase
VIIGIGTDIVDVMRIEKACEHPRFLMRNFTQHERDYFSLKGNATATVAAHFAMKEAVSKALGTGFREFGFIDIDIIHDERGKPICRLEPKAQAVMVSNGIDDILVSCSHEKQFAIGFAIATRF